MPFVRHPIVIAFVLLILVPQGSYAGRAAHSPAPDLNLTQGRNTHAKTIKGAWSAGRKQLLKGAGWAARKVGGAVDRKAAKLEENGHLRTAKTIKLLAGTDTLLNTSFDFGMGAGMATPFSRVFNVGAGIGFWSGSVKFHERGIKDVMVSASYGVDSPFFGGGYSTLGKWGGGIYPLPFISGFKDQRTYGVSIGNSGLVDLVFGEVGPSVNKHGQRVPARGPFVDFHVALPILPFVSYLSVYIGFTSPLLRPLTKPMERPAGWLDDRGRILSESFTNKGMKLLKKAHPELKTTDSTEHLLSSLTQHKKLVGTIPMRNIQKQARRLTLVDQALKSDIEVPLATLLLARRSVTRIKNIIEGGAPLRDSVRAFWNGEKGLKSLKEGQTEPLNTFGISESMTTGKGLAAVKRNRIKKWESRLKIIEQALQSNKAIPLDALLYARSGITKLRRVADQKGVTTAGKELDHLLQLVLQEIHGHRTQDNTTVQKIKTAMSENEYQKLLDRVDGFLSSVNGAIQRQRQERTELQDLPDWAEVQSL